MSTKIPLTLTVDVTAGASTEEPADKATWTAAAINDLPDSAFLYIEPGGKKDEDGKTVPRSLRHFPVRGPDGKVDLPHLRNAIARIPQADIPADLKDKLQARARRMLEEAQKGASLEADFELRGRLLKAADEQADSKLHYVLNVVLEPNPLEAEATRDTQGDAYGKADIWQARRSYMKSQALGLMHEQLAKGVALLDNWVTPVAFEFGGQKVAEGSWLVGAEIDEAENPELWAGIKSGAINAFSIAGVARRTPLA
jgi:hypothetical protein